MLLKCSVSPAAKSGCQACAAVAQVRGSAELRVNRCHSTQDNVSKVVSPGLQSTLQCIATARPISTGHCLLARPSSAPATSNSPRLGWGFTQFDARLERSAARSSSVRRHSSDGIRHQVIQAKDQHCQRNRQTYPLIACHVKFPATAVRNSTVARMTVSRRYSLLCCSAACPSEMALSDAA